MGWFTKEKVTESDAAGVFVHQMTSLAKTEWPVVARSLDQSGSLGVAKLAGELWAGFEYSLAVMAIQSQAVKKLLPEDPAERIVEAIERRLDVPDLKGIGLDGFSCYLEAWAGALDNPVTPTSVVAVALLGRLEMLGRMRDPARRTGSGPGPTKPDPALVAALGSRLGDRKGWWKWFLHKFKVVAD